jgi:GT2 family glycosyltransferase
MVLSVISVTWNVEELIAKQISSVFAGCNNISCEEIVIDNGSTDKTVEIVRSYPEVHLIANKTNDGFSAANNQGLAAAKGEFLLFLNPDMQVEEGSLDVIVQWMKDHPDVGIVSPKLLDEHGNVNREAGPRRLPRVWEQLAIILKLPHVFPSMLNKYHLSDFDFDKEQEVDSVRGSFMLMRREFVEKLGWAYDPRFFIWYEDVDICREAKKNGYKVMYTPVISCVDYVGQSFKKRVSLWKQKNFTKSMLQYFKKWEPWYAWLPIMIVRPVGIAMAWGHDKVSK